MLDLENYHPISEGRKCKECAHYFLQRNDHSPNYLRKCELKRRTRYYDGYGKFVEYGSVKANQPACLNFKEDE